MTTDRPDLDGASDEIAEILRQRRAKQAEIRQRIVAGLAPDGKHLRRNAQCPCGSGKKFKKCCLPNMKEKLTPTKEAPDAPDSTT